MSEPDFITSELAIVVLGKSHNPTVLNPDFLKINKIVPAGWNLAEAPICFEPMSQVAFSCGVKIIAQLDKVIVSEKIIGKPIEDVHAPGIALEYTKTLPHVEYTALGINFKGHHNERGGDKAILNRFIKDGVWKKLGERTPKASIKFSYDLGNVICNIDIQSAIFKEPEGKAINVVSCATNYHHDLIGSDRSERLAYLHTHIENWVNDYGNHSSLIHSFFKEN